MSDAAAGGPAAPAGGAARQCEPPGPNGHPGAEHPDTAAEATADARRDAARA